MKKRDIESLIVSAYETATPDKLDSIKNACMLVSQEEEEPDYLKSPEKKKVGLSAVYRVAFATAACLIFFLIGNRFGMLRQTPIVDEGDVITVGDVIDSDIEPTDIAPSETDAAYSDVTEEDTSSNLANMGGEVIQEGVDNIDIVPSIKEEEPVIMPYATIFIDVNPSIEMTVNEQMRVISCVPVNEDAVTILGEMELEGVSVHTALNAIIGSMYMQGYLQADTGAMLVSVDSDADTVLEEIVADVNKIFNNNLLECELISISIETEELSELAQINGISAGKMGLIEFIIESSAQYTDADISELSGLNILSLKNILDFAQNVISETDSSMIDSGNEYVDLVIDDTFDLAEDVVDDINQIVEDVVDGLIDEIIFGEIGRWFKR